MDALLTHWGYQVVSLRFLGKQTAADVLEQVKLQKFYVALVDNFKMPPLLDTDLPAQIKRLSPATKIIIMDLVPVLPAVADAPQNPHSDNTVSRELSCCYDRLP